jgi:sugar phosphate isomerase/epimerase
VFGGGFPEDWTRDAAIGHCVEAFRRVAPHAAERKIKLAFETHDAWTDPSHVMAVIDKIDVGSVQVNWDVMHPVRSSGYTMEGAFEILNGSICHVHVHDGTTSNDNLEIRKMGSGEYDHQTAIGLLKESGYTGFISGEWIESAMPDDYGYREHLPHELAMLREYERKAGRDGRGTA